ncbi:diguanylate cyclase [Roseibium sp.]|uniref:sensor domain-containing diguanylate cyclase n=1 Tax=Roseibium sp. TaxID=1936156 RepID=UPI003A976415
MSIDESPDFFTSVLNSMSQQIAVIDSSGLIRWVNSAWMSFAVENGGAFDHEWTETNYLNVCGASRGEATDDALKVFSGIQTVVDGEAPIYYHEYPCHSPTEDRWFMMRIRPLKWDGPPHFLITHQNITERKKAEFRVQELAMLDGLTGIANRRRFDVFLEEEWRRGRRGNYSVSLALIDLDFFKRFNDHYGHLAGDECLRSVGEVLRGCSRRPEDLVARYGGEEFAIILGNTPAEGAAIVAEKVRQAIHSLKIPHELGSVDDFVTASIGVATFNPGLEPEKGIVELIEAADQALYAAKEQGRNRVCVFEDRVEPKKLAAGASN